MKGLSKILIIFLLLTNVLLRSYSQPVSFNHKDLYNRTWSQPISNNSTHKLYFQKDKMSIYYDQAFIGRMEYYLSDTICRIFEPKKVGRVHAGNYIIQRAIRDKRHPNTRLPVTCLQIVELNTKKLILETSKNLLIEFDIDTSFKPQSNKHQYKKKNKTKKT